MPAHNPENPGILRIGSSTPRFYKLPFEEAVKKMVLAERNQTAIQTSFDDDDFYVPSTTHFELQAIYSNEPVRSVKLTKGGYVIGISDADYVMYEGQTRMSGRLLGRQMEREDGFLIMQSFLDQNTFTNERNRIIQSLPVVPILKSSEHDKAS